MIAKQNKNLKQSKNLASTARAISLALGLSMLSFAGTHAAQAADSKSKSAPRIDYFGSSTSIEAPKATKKPPAKELPVGSAGSESLESVAIKTPVVICFERIDDIRAKYVPSEKEKVIITRPINQQAERLQQWVETARSIANEFTTCSKTLRAAKIPADCDDLVDFRNMTADWYADVACVYSDMIKPRPSAKTIEQLQAQADSFKQRQASLKTTQKQLARMEDKLRKQYRVHKDINTDALSQYILGKDK
jgi:prefoldin subunit 5